MAKGRHSARWSATFSVISVPLVKMRDEQTAALGVGVDRQEVRPRERLAAGVEKPQAAGLDDLVHEAEVLVAGELPPARGVVGERRGCCSSGRRRAGSAR